MSNFNANTVLRRMGGTPPVPPPPIVADFSGTPTTVDAGNTVAFTDLSTGTPTSWTWTLPGGTPSSSSLQNPTIQYNTTGSYDVTLLASNATSSDTEVKKFYIQVVPPTPPPPFTWNLNTRTWDAETRVWA